METRIVLELTKNPKTSRTWKNIKQTLQKKGATYITKPPETQPYIITAIMPDEKIAQETVKFLRATEGIRNADIDQMRTTF